MSAIGDSETATATARSGVAEAELAQEIRQRRKVAGVSQAELANRVGYSREYVSRAERPSKGLVSEHLIARIDAELGADGALIALRAKAQRNRLARRQTTRPARQPDVEEEAEVMRRSEFLRLAAAAAGGLATPRPLVGLFTDPRLPDGTAAEPHWAVRTHQAVIDPTGEVRRWRGEAGAQDIPPLRPMVDRAMLVSLTSDYGALERSLPSLLGRAEWEVLDDPCHDARQRTLSDVYSLIGWMLIKADDVYAAWLAAQRATQAAENAKDGIRIAAATRCLAEVHMRGGNFGRAVRTALLATIGLADEPDKRLALSIRGAALLSAAAASARNGERREAYSLLAAATRCADDLGRDGLDLATVFGPANVAIHRVVIAVELADARQALAAAETVKLDQLPELLAERKSRFLLDVARAQVATGSFSTAVDTLIEAEATSPDETRRHRITHGIIPQLLAHERRHSGLREFATRCATC